jgi:hypothetical protein
MGSGDYQRRIVDYDSQVLALFWVIEIVVRRCGSAR